MKMQHISMCLMYLAYLCVMWCECPSFPQPKKIALLQIWPCELMMTAAALIFTSAHRLRKPRLTMALHPHPHHHTHTHTVTGHGGTCFWQCLNSWNCGHPSAPGLIIGPAPWWVIDTDDKPVWGSYRAANPSTSWHLLCWHSSNHRPRAKLKNPLPLKSKYCLCWWHFLIQL